MFDKLSSASTTMRRAEYAASAGEPAGLLRQNCAGVCRGLMAGGLSPDPGWQLDDRQDGLERLALVRRRRGLDAELVIVQV